MRALKYLKVKEKYKIKEILNLMKSWNSELFKRNPNPKTLERGENLSLQKLHLILKLLIMKACSWMDAFPHFIASNLCFLGWKLGQKQPRNCPQWFLLRSGHGKVTRRRHPRVCVDCIFARSYVRMIHAFASPGFREAMANYISLWSPRR